MAKRNDEYFLLCITDSSKAIVGTGALIVERKFIAVRRGDMTLV